MHDLSEQAIDGTTHVSSGSVQFPSKKATPKTSEVVRQIICSHVFMQPVPC